jgi:hypothetical protein
MTTPAPRPPCLVSVYDGQRCLGFILARGKSGFEAFDSSDVSLGLHAHMQAAADAISAGAQRKEGKDEASR